MIHQDPKIVTEVGARQSQRPGAAHNQGIASDNKDICKDLRKGVLEGGMTRLKA